MRKAVDYAQQWNDNPTIDTIREISFLFLMECKELIDTRNAKTDAAVIAVFREQDRKWRSFCAKAPGVNPDGFRNLVKSEFSSIYNDIKW